MKSASLLVSLLLLNFNFPLATPASAQTGARDLSYTISTSQPWTDTGVDLLPGDSLMISASAASGSGCDPKGVSGAARSANLPAADAAPGALLARLENQGSAIEVGSSKEVRADTAGHLFLGVNAGGTPPCAGSFAVKVRITPGPAPASAAARSATPVNNAASEQSSRPTADEVKKKLANAAQVWLQGQFGSGQPSEASSSSTSAVAGNDANPGSAPAAVALEVSKDKLDPPLSKDIDGLPRRVNDEFNNLGDMVNFVMVGSKEQIQSSLEAATWHVADTNTTESALKAVIETYQNKDYMSMPMSQLRLFGRVQDYGYEMAEPYAVVASRHHFRIWKAPFTYKDQTVWVGAGTHDIGFEKDQRNGKVTHKIDPNVDGERENIASSLQKAGKAKSLYYYLPPDPVQEARNATGGGYHSDGRIIVIMLK